MNYRFIIMGIASGGCGLITPPDFLISPPNMWIGDFGCAAYIRWWGGVLEPALAEPGRFDLLTHGRFCAPLVDLHAGGPAFGHRSWTCRATPACGGQSNGGAWAAGTAVGKGTMEPRSWY